MKNEFKILHSLQRIKCSLRTRIILFWQERSRNAGLEVLLLSLSSESLALQCISNEVPVCSLSPIGAVSDLRDTKGAGNSHGGSQMVGVAIS